MFLRFTLALVCSLLLHHCLVNGWLRNKPEHPDNGSAGRATLAIQAITVRRKPAPEPVKLQASDQGVIKQPLAVEGRSSLLAKTDQVEPVAPELPNKPVVPEKHTELDSHSPEPQISTVKEVISPDPERLESIVEEGTPADIPEETEAQEAIEVVSSSEFDAVHAGFDELPTMSEPRYRKARPPRYPKLAKRWGQQGIVMVRAKVGIDGLVEAVELLRSSGYSSLDDCALDTVSHWEFYPYQLDEHFVAAWVEVPVEFTLR